MKLQNLLNIRVRGVPRILVRGGKHQTKFPIRSPEFRFGAVTFSKILLNKDFLKNLYKIRNKILKNSPKFIRKTLIKYKKYKKF